MANKIDEVFGKNEELKIMTHVVAGYPDLETSGQLIKVMAESGADLVEIQIPFSDPLADGATIMEATQHALNAGITPEHCFELAHTLKDTVDIPLLFMSYANIPYKYGVEQFIIKSKEAGIQGLIVPDLPIDEENENYFSIIKNYDVHPILVVSPDMNEDRLASVAKHGSGFIYSTLKVGITGAMNAMKQEGLFFLDVLRKHTPLPIAAGFGISKPEHVAHLRGNADAAVIGSRVITLFNEEGLDGVRDLILQCKDASTALGANG